MAASMFTWTTTHKELVAYLSKNRSQQKKLVGVLRSAGVTSLTDKLRRNGKAVDLEVIDPFTFFCYIYKYGATKRVEVLANVARQLKLTVPSDADGIPSVNAQQVCMFPFAYERKHDEVNRLWRFFDRVLSGTVDDAAFADVLQVAYTGPAKITEGLFNIMPEKYLPINGPVKQYLKDTHNIKAKITTWTDYLTLLENIKAKEPIPFTELSYKSWLLRDEKERAADDTDTPRYWLYAPGERAEQWETFSAAGIMAIGWSGAGDLSTYDAPEDVETALRKASGTTKRLTHDARTCYQFASVIKPGDVVIARKGRKTLVGWGVVTSDYRYESGQEYKHLIDVDWKSKGAWTTEQTLPIITLTELTDKRGDLTQIRKQLGITDDALLTGSHKPTSFIAPLNVILYGPPGTGKTHATIKRAAEIVAGRSIETYAEAQDIFRKHHSSKSIEMVTFHQSYSYEDFVQGLRPDVENGSALMFQRHDGVFKRIADRARAAGANERFVLIIDEINRANISRVFGELITLIEPDKRTQGKHAMEVTLPSGETFSVPSNLYIIGTMNTADKSIALLDIALRRRFVFEAMYPQYRIPGAVVHDADLLERINRQIIKLKGHDFQIGHAYFMGDDYRRLDAMNNSVIPLLMEYFMNDTKRVQQILIEAGLNVHETAWPLQVVA